MKKITFVIELDRCIGCKGCQASCKMANGVALGNCRNPVKTVGPHGTYPDIQMYFMPAMCQQCENPSCVAVCPTGACYVNDEDGVILIDENLCIGCRSCEEACPYDCCSLNQERLIMDKCNICLSRRAEGEMPACVKNCSGSCLHVGDINDPESEVSRLLKEAGEENIYTLRDFGNHPSICYILKNEKWMDLLPQECRDTKRGKGCRS
ncbi:MAG: 4Fe-4S dicluster domain-containing protein [Clostridiales bacterium]|nr:4Fe-4S dicluster domain-containing protein [Clostridiales bacterium]